MPTWIDDLPAEQADTISDEDKPLAAKYDSLGEYMKGATNAQSRLGNSVRVPGPDAPAEDVTAYHQKLINMDSKLMEKPDLTGGDQTETFYRSIGKPEKAEDYVMPDGIKLPDETQVQMKEVGFTSNMTQANFKTWAQDIDARNTVTMDGLTSAAETDMGALKTKWGMAYDERSAAARKVMADTGSYPGREFDTLGAADIESLYAINGMLTGKGAQVHDQPGAGTGEIDTAEAQSRIEEMSRKANDRNNDLSPQERTQLIQKVIKMKQKYIPRFAQTA